MTLQELQKKLDRLASDYKQKIEDELHEALKETAEEIKKRVTLGYGCSSTGGPKERLKPLSTEYKKQRKKIKLGKDATPSKSNLHKSGDMVQSIHADKNTIKVSSSEENKAKWAKEKGRPFLNITKQELQRLKDRMKTKILKLLDNL